VLFKLICVKFQGFESIPHFVFTPNPLAKPANYCVYTVFGKGISGWPRILLEIPFTRPKPVPYYAFYRFDSGGGLHHQ
jgi:hypothetical protein